MASEGVPTSSSSSSSSSGGQTSAVQLYVYDLSNGLARALSMQLTGRQFDAVYHTSIVVHDKEYYFGQGIFACPTPGRTHFGMPIERIALGDTFVDKETFAEILDDLKARFAAKDYDLFHHNCNTFSNELANILVGKDIPAHITSLPQDFLATPFGQMLGAQARSGPPGEAPPTRSQLFDEPVLPNGEKRPYKYGPMSRYYWTSGPPEPRLQHAASIDLTNAPVRKIETTEQLDEFRRSEATTIVMYASELWPQRRELERYYRYLCLGHAEKTPKPYYRPIAFGEVETSTCSPELLSREQVTEMPVFHFFQYGQKTMVHRGGRETDLEERINFELSRTNKTHPHWYKTHLIPTPETNPKSPVPRQPIIYRSIPDLARTRKKLNDIISTYTEKVTPDQQSKLKKGRDALLNTLMPSNAFVALIRRMNAKDAQTWMEGARSCLEILECKDAFPVIDIVRIALLSEDQGETMAQEGEESLLDEICDKAHKGMDLANRATLLTTFRLIGNVVAGSDRVKGLAMRMANNPVVPTLLAFGVLSEDDSTRSAAIDASFNWARLRGKVNLQPFSPETQKEDEEPAMEEEIEVICALLQCIENEENLDRLLHAVSALLLVLYAIPAWLSTVRPMLMVLDAATKLHVKADALHEKDSSARAFAVCQGLELAELLCLQS